MLLGAPIAVRQVLFWNLLPVTLGNIIAGALFTGMALYATYAAKPVPAVSSAELPVETPAAQPATFAAAAGVQQM
jgi:hypothetical protein